MRALQNRGKASLWVISFLAAGYSTVIIITFAYMVLYGVLPNSSLWLLATAPVIPEFQVPVIIAARKDVELWASRSRTSLARKIITKIAPFVADRGKRAADDSAPELPAEFALCPKPPAPTAS